MTDNIRTNFCATCKEQADRIKALTAEVEWLEALFTNATYEARAMMEEIERLRAELSSWREMAGKVDQ
jgi:uncharacterized small protein (DUF1192 family)